MARRTEFVDFVTEQLAPLGAVRAKAMFGGFGVYLDDLMFAIIVDDSLYFKADAATRAEFAALGLRPFTYSSRGKTVVMQYYEAPPDVFESSDAMHDWARLAIGAALRGKTPRRTRTTPRDDPRQRANPPTSSNLMTKP